ncbi:MAG TPA: sigma-54 dependent transcriptional regulator [Rhodothermales bacterium]|nr:sigma-54 dependent transcriptional regulator [Rhodothermales bacterium]
MARPRILVVDDEPSIRRTLREILEYEKYDVEESVDGEQVLEAVKSKRFDVVLLDVKMPKRDGMEVLRVLRSDFPQLPVVMISGHGNIETAVEATRMGAFDFIEKPPDLNRLLVTVRNALDRGVLEVENRHMKRTIAEKYELGPILGESRPIEDIKTTIQRVAPTEARVLITGEPGTGKELVARWIHHSSNRSAGPMVEVNCAAIPSELIESELFGHEEGSFTGATRQRVGKFELANEGTLFLDEIGDMSLSAQAKVLRALQENKISRVGGDRAIPVDVRVISATNKDLLAEMAENRFRDDLYHRLSVIIINVPPLRDRRDDIPLLAEEFSERLARRNGMVAKPFDEAALARLKTLEWRGNVRELHNVVERLLILSLGNRVAVEDVDRLVAPGNASADPILQILGSTDQFADFRDAAEALFIRKKLDEFDWNVSRTAEAIGIQRSHLYNKLNKYGIDRGDDANVE